MTAWTVLEALGVGIAALLLAWTLLLYVPLRWWPVGRYLWVPKLAAAAFAPFIVAAGLLLALAGGLGGSGWLAVPAALAAMGAAIVVVRLGRVRADLTGALGPDWADRIPVQRRVRMVGRWWGGRLPTVPEPRLRQNVVFATVPGTDRALLCDVWQPPASVPSSGLAVVSLHGSAWCMLDKDVGTRPLFRHLTAQGHLVVEGPADRLEMGGHVVDRPEMGIAAVLARGVVYDKAGLARLLETVAASPDLKVDDWGRTRRPGP